LDKKFLRIQIFYNISPNILDTMAHNVLVVNDGLPARIRACVARPGLANCGGVRRGNGEAMT